MEDSNVPSTDQLKLSSTNQINIKEESINKIQEKMDFYITPYNTVTWINLMIKMSIHSKFVMPNCQ